MFFGFFFQAEDGIRDWSVTGVQTCALPISALKLARNYHRMHGKGQKHKLIAREIAYHGTSLGALSATGITELRSQFEPLAPGGCHVPNTNVYRLPADREPTW